MQTRFGGLLTAPPLCAVSTMGHGVLGLTKVVALGTATTNITCNPICPGWVLTPLMEKQIEERASREDVSVDQAKRELLAEKQPPQEFARPTQIGSLAVFLCSEAAPDPRRCFARRRCLDCAITAPFILIFINVESPPVFSMRSARLNLIA